MEVSSEPPVVFQEICRPSLEVVKMVGEAVAPPTSTSSVSSEESLVQIQACKALLALVTSPFCEVHGRTLLNVLDVGLDVALSFPTSSAETSPPPTRFDTALLNARVSAVDLILCIELGCAYSHTFLYRLKFIYLPSLNFAFSYASQDPVPIAVLPFGAIARQVKCQTRVRPICSLRSSITSTVRLKNVASFLQ